MQRRRGRFKVTQQQSCPSFRAGLRSPSFHNAPQRPIHLRSLRRAKPRPSTAKPDHSGRKHEAVGHSCTSTKVRQSILHLVTLSGLTCPSSDCDNPALGYPAEYQKLCGIWRDRSQGIWGPMPQLRTRAAKFRKIHSIAKKEPEWNMLSASPVGRVRTRVVDNLMLGVRVSWLSHPEVPEHA